MAQIVNRHAIARTTTLGHTLWLTAVCVGIVFTGGNLARVLVKGAGGVQRIQKIGVVRAFTERTMATAATSGSPAARLYVWRRVGVPALHLGALVALSQLFAMPLAAMRRGGGRKRVARGLQHLPDDCWVLCDLQVPGSKETAHIDYVIASPRGLWCLEVKDQRGHVTGGEMDFEWYEYGRKDRARRYPHAFYNPIRQNNTHCAVLSNYLAMHGWSAPVQSLVVFPDAELELMTKTPVERPEDIAQAIRERDGEAALTREQLRAIVGSLSGLLELQAAPRRAPGVLASAQP